MTSRPAETPRTYAWASRAAKVVVLAAAATVGLALLSQVGYSPMWDGRIYADCIAAAALHPTPGAMRCAGHASHASVALAALVQSPAPGSFPLLLAANALLLAAAWMAFDRLTALVFHAPDQALDRALLGALFAVQPTLLAAVVQPGLDLPVVPAFIWCVVFALSRRWIALGIAGCLLVFTKETGVLLYGALLALVVLSQVMSARERARLTLGHVFRWLLPSVAPLAVFGAYLLYRATLPGEPVIWTGGTIGRSVVAQFLVPSVDLYQTNYAMLILVLQFGWLLTAVIAVDALIGGVRKLERKPPRELPGTHRSRLALVVVLLLVTGYALTRFITFGNPRYFLVPRVLLLVPAYAALLRLGVTPTVRRAILATTAILSLVSAVRTIDPVSRAAYGTFAVGEHRLLRMTSITSECCGFGRDQLVYNLEFGWLQRAADAALRSVAPAPMSSSDSIVIVVPDSALGTLSSAWLAGPDAVSVYVDAVPKLVTRSHGTLLSGASRLDTATFIALPTVDYTRALRELATLYVIGAPRELDIHGYRVSTYRMTRRPTTGP
jgi:hypothetical protein